MLRVMVFLFLSYMINRITCYVKFSSDTFDRLEHALYENDGFSPKLVSIGIFHTMKLKIRQ